MAWRVLFMVQGGRIAVGPQAVLPHIPINVVKGQIISPNV
jgi:hypothetical protein